MCCTQSLNEANASRRGRQSSQGHIIPSDKVTLRLENSNWLSVQCGDEDRLTQGFPEAETWVSGGVCIDFEKNLIMIYIFSLFIEILHIVKRTQIMHTA